MKRHCLLTALVLILAVLLGIPGPSAAQDSDTLARMQQEGWTIVKDGVLQRELRVGQVESFVFGVPGFQWKLQDLQKQLRTLRAAYAADPTADLRKAILNHRKEISNTQKMIELARRSEASGLTGIDKVSCTLSFAYQADASYLTSSQGTWGNASASFTGNCGFTGEVYAYAYAKTTVAGAPSTQTVTDGPRSGANVSATAYASRTGVPACESSSYASMTSGSLNPSSYSMSASNPSSCPAPPSNPVPTINGTNYIAVDVCVTTTWTSSVSAGSSPYTYQWTWNGASVSTGSSYSRTICPGVNYNYTTNTLALTVTDSASRTGGTSKSVDVERFGTSGCAVAPCP